ncbi:restriction endonuclease subunit S [Pelagicoccus sp. SDUM812005]|uniref:restriction endonuclease subunit S n=1 Tax=Pelagicoccus sp. SDUM812005 TaxID=3041257 RepID=UPI002812803A|nr:restriction endonuclease subunit S [Pelagicoccus sp. SDUM812005]
MREFRAYPEYRDASSEWLDDIPKDWDRTPLKFVVSTRITDGPHETPEILEEGVPFLSAEAVKEFKLDFNRKRGYISRDLHIIYSKKCLPRLGDVFMVKSGNTTGAIAMVETDEEFNIWSPLALIRADQRKMLPRFVYYSMRADFFRTSVELSWSQGTQPNIGMGVIENLHLALPSIGEQQKIADFLDHKTAKIDRLIEKQQELIELLREKRQAAISHAVTKGLNPNAPLKPSGVEWLGDVPEHWDVHKTKRLFSLECHPSPVDNGMELLSVYTEIGVRPRKDLEQKGNKASSTDGYWLVKKGDIVVNKLLAWMGAVGYSDFEGVTSPAYDILRKRKPLNPWFYHYLFRTKLAQGEFKRWSRGIMEMRLRLYFDELGQIDMPFPPVEEQNLIVESMRKMESSYDELIDKASLQIELLQERRTALISAAVTGKLDVRDWQAPALLETEATS